MTRRRKTPFLMLKAVILFVFIKKIKEGNKERIQIFEGVVIRTDRKKSHTSRITVRKIASGVGVEKSFLLHSPLLEKIEMFAVRSSPNYLSFLRNRSGKSARLKQVAFDREAVNTLPEASKAEEKLNLQKKLNH